MPFTDGGVGSASFGVGATKSAVMVLGPRWRLPDFDLHLGGVNLPVVLSYKHLGVLLTPTVSWTVQLLISRATASLQCVAWCRAEHLPVQMASSLFGVHVLPTVSWRSEFSHTHQQLCTSWMEQSADGNRHHLGWPLGLPCAGVLCELCWLDAEHLALGRLLSL